MDLAALLIVVVPGVVLYIWYAKLIARRNAARAALSSIDVQLKKRHDLLPNILKLAGRFMTHEKELLEDLTALRARVDAGYDPADPAAVQAHLAVEIFPGSMSAGWAKVKAMPFWEMEDSSHRAAVNVDDYLK